MDGERADLAVLIVESRTDLATLWEAHLTRMDCTVSLATSEDDAIHHLRHNAFDVVVLDLILPGGGAFAIADFTGYRWPAAKVIFVTNSSFFSDGSIFRHISNAAALVPSDTTPEDLGAMVQHYGTDRAQS